MVDSSIYSIYLYIYIYIYGDLYSSIQLYYSRVRVQSTLTDGRGGGGGGGEELNSSRVRVEYSWVPTLLLPRTRMGRIKTLRRMRTVRRYES